MDGTIKILVNVSSSVRHYYQVMSETTFYLAKLRPSTTHLQSDFVQDIVIGRDGIPCKLCDTLLHYIMECNCLKEFRD